MRPTKPDDMVGMEENPFYHARMNGALGGSAAPSFYATLKHHDFGHEEDTDDMPSPPFGTSPNTASPYATPLPLVRYSDMPAPQSKSGHDYRAIGVAGGAKGEKKSAYAGVWTTSFPYAGHGVTAGAGAGAGAGSRGGDDSHGALYADPDENESSSLYDHAAHTPRIYTIPRTTSARGGSDGDGNHYSRLDRSSGFDSWAAPMTSDSDNNHVEYETPHFPILDRSGSVGAGGAAGAGGAIGNASNRTTMFSYDDDDEDDATNGSTVTSTRNISFSTPRVGNGYELPGMLRSQRSGSVSMKGTHEAQSSS